MDVLTPPEKPDNDISALGSRIAAAQAELRRAAQLGALRNDPLHFVLEGIAGALGAIHDVSASLAVTGQSVAAAVEQVGQPLGQDVLGPIQRAAAAGATREVLSVARAIHWRTMILGGIGVGLAAVIAFVAGNFWGQARAAASFRATEANLAAAFRNGPQDAARWLALMRWNDIGTALGHCQVFTDQTTGRRACMVPLWIAAPKRRVPGG